MNLLIGHSLDMIFYFKSSVIGTVQGMITILVRVIPTTGNIFLLVYCLFA